MQILFVGIAGIAKMRVRVDETGRGTEAFAVEDMEGRGGSGGNPGDFFGEIRLYARELSVFNKQIRLSLRSGGGII